VQEGVKKKATVAMLLSPSFLSCGVVLQRNEEGDDNNAAVAFFFLFCCCAAKKVMATKAFLFFSLVA
jgi:hypothetical protein